MSQTPASYPSYQTMANSYVAAQIQHYYQLQAAQLQQQMIAQQQQQQNLLLSNRQHDQLNNINSNQSMSTKYTCTHIITCLCVLLLLHDIVPVHVVLY